MGKAKEVSFNMRHFGNPASMRGSQQNLYGPENVSPKDINLRRKSLVKSNIGRFFIVTYQGMFGGKASLRYVQSNGDYHSYQPDVVHTFRRGRIDVELKAFSTSFTGQSLCPVPQFENYMLKLLERLELAEKGRYFDSHSLGFNYGFFRYCLPSKRIIRRGTHAGVYSNGRPKCRKVPSGEPLVNLTPSAFIKAFGDYTKDLLVVPSNLLFPLLYGSKSAVLDQTRGRSNMHVTKQHWYVRSGDIGMLHDPHRGIDSLIARQAERTYLPGVPFDSKSIGSFTSQDLLLDRLEMTQRESPELLLNGRYRIPSFPVTVYEFKTQKDRAEWNKVVQKRHTDLAALLGVRDLYQEAQETPF